MSEDAATGQARLLLVAMHDQLADCTSRLGLVERRMERCLSPSSTDRRVRAQLRRDHLKVQSMIEAIYQRFPHLCPTFHD